MTTSAIRMASMMRGMPDWSAWPVTMPPRRRSLDGPALPTIHTSYAASASTGSTAWPSFAPSWVLEADSGGIIQSARATSVLPGRGWRRADEDGTMNIAIDEGRLVEG